MQILVVEDDPRVARAVARGLAEGGYRVDHAADGLAGLERAETGAYDLIILDVLLPEIDGFAVAKRLRAARVRTPILMLTARDAVADRVRGLDAGADDYLVKPFALAELLARVRAHLRRTEPDDGATLRVGDLTLDVERRRAQRDGHTVELTAKECELLEYLMRNADQILTKEQIMARVWGYEAEVTSNVVEIYIHYLRDKIDRGFPSPLIRTVRGAGYTLKE